ncbi:hypothetical protein KCU81_g7698, partial [Aureobasidium melanogenum]|uniref:ubiquitinyl hydrolase 1 n=1 Tax=Aureobasidium melanogenum (strain CBS 110374) TaxID=1043003 RepID=A0A074VM31_AURM1
MRPNGSALGVQDVQNLINHIALPPQLPQAEEPDPSTIDKNILLLLQTAGKTFEHRNCAAWTSVTKMLSTLAKTERAKTLSDGFLITHMEASGPGDCIALNLPSHNSALLFLRKSPETIVIEAFEVSATNESIMSTQGRLTRHFPSRAVACPSKKFFDTSFQAELHIALRRLGSEGPPKSYQPKTIRSNNALHETRETMHPGFVNDYLMTILSVVGQNHPSITSQKSTRDDVLWKDTKYCWRRQPFWIFCKVAILRTLLLTLSPEEAREQYKLFMIDVVACLLKRSREMPIDLQMLSVVHVKLARRALKFEQQYGKSPGDHVLSISSIVRATLDETWTQHIARIESLGEVAVQGWEDATSLTLPNIREKLARVLSSSNGAGKVPKFTPESQTRHSQDYKVLPSLGSSASAKFPVTHLVDLETWVEHHLSAWTKLALQKNIAEPCEKLLKTITEYWNQAATAYHGIPREMSHTLLVIMELWVALDKISCLQTPLMAEYPPEVPTDILQPLLLPTTSQMERLSAIESYIDRRWSQAVHLEHSAFEYPTSSSFTVRFYDISPSLQDLHARIKQSDDDARAAKVQELAIATHRYEQLMAEADQLEHTYDYNDEEEDDDDESHDESGCVKCQKESEAKDMTIKYVEKSLPTNLVQLKAAVFELQTPAQFAAWRDATWFILNDIGQRKVTTGGPAQTTVLTYDQLRRYAACKTTRITLGSSTKPTAIRSHYRDKALPTTMKELFVENSLKYKLWDVSASTWVVWPGVKPDFKTHCTLTLPSGPYEDLDWAIRTSQHTSNEVISRQHECDVRLEKNEFLSFGNLRAGERIQWINILRELGCTNLDFTHPAVTTAILQAAWEAGSPSNDILRNAHAEFASPLFCSKLLSMLHRRLIAIENNWDRQYSMMAVIQLTLRLTSLTSDTDTELGCLQLLRRARRVALDWCQQIELHIYQTPGNEEIQNDGVKRILLAALLCYSTFDVEDQYIEQLLNSAEDLALAIEAQSIVCDNTPSDNTALCLLLRQSLVGHLKIAHKLEPRIHGILRQHGAGITSAVQKIWNGVCLEPTWYVLSNSALSWVQNKTIPVGFGQAQQIDYNLLSGSLLVDGKPMGKVPDNIKSDPLVLQLFGNSVLRVFASDDPDMDYRVSQHIEGNEVHLGVRNHEVVIKSRVHDQTYYALPRETFNDALPDHFVKSFHHWMNESTGEVEFRPLDQPWQASQNNWRMCFSSLNFVTAQAMLQQGSKRLIDIHSKVGKTVTSIFCTLDDPLHCHIIFDDSHRAQLKVELPRYDLHFIISEKGETKSLEFNAVVDEDQAIGTFIGLQNKLVLRSIVPPGCPQERLVLVPFGPISVERTENHVSVSINDSTKLKRRHFVYTVDRHLRKLRGAQDLLGHLYQAYLHAITSYCLPDSFTGSTGTEEALNILGSAFMFTSSGLQPDEIELLEKISCLTPSRQFYPRGRRVMQTVTWDPDLPMLSQHDDFVLASQAIVQHHRKYELACGQRNDTSIKIDRGDTHLLERARKRNSVTTKAGLISSLTPREHDDVVYSARDAFNRDLRARKVHEIATLVQEWPSYTFVYDDLAYILESWERVSGYQSSFNPKKALMHNLTTIRLADHWGSLYEMCRKADRNSMAYPLLFTFSAMTFGVKDEEILGLRTLLAFAMSPSFLCEDPPAHHESYDLSAGASANFEQINKMIKNRAEYPSKPKYASQQQKCTWARERDAVNYQVDQVTEFIFKQWPSESVKLPEGNFPGIPMLRVLQECQILWSKWYKNSRFLTHIASVSNKLKTIYCPQKDCSWSGVPLVNHVQSHDYLLTLDLDFLLSCDETITQSRIVVQPPVPLTWSAKSGGKEQSDITSLNRLVDSLASKGGTHEKYASILRSSLHAFHQLEHSSIHQQPPLKVEAFNDFCSDLLDSVKAQLQAIHHDLGPSGSAETILANADLWPRTSESALLSYLSSAKISKLAPAWKATLLNFAEKIASLQRAERMLRSAKLQDYRTLCKELETPGREGWSLHEHPSWLLLEIENNITIRPLQAKVAKEMMSPSSGANSVMQLNMGEGKSSVIIPMLATALADGHHLVRVVVLKSLLRQTEQVLLQRLGNLLGHRICHIPFSRKTRIDGETICGMSEIATDFCSNRGVMVALPEEILSMKLMTREKIVSDKDLAAAILDLQNSLKNICRDIIDESDEILGIRSQLIYPVGSQHMLDGKDDRWLVAQGVLRQVKHHALSLSKQFPSEINATMGKKSIPDINFLDPAVFYRLLDLLVDDALEGQIAGVALHYFSVEDKIAIRNFIHYREVSKQDLATLHKNCIGSSHWNTILILRGLFARDILSFVLLRKRWLVEYGLDPARCLMAVPYQAKGVPTQNSEFGHADVGVVLTCLSYYYTGLSMAQVEDCFRILLKDTNAQDIYTGWALASNLPANFSSLDSINLDDRLLCQKSLFPKLQYTLECIDFFLNQVVFPKEGKEFSKRLSASGWDIPSSSASLDLVTTGFSGTNDSRVILPYSIEQQDLDELQHTNAMVLNLLLRPENQKYIHGGSDQGGKLSVTELLKLISQQKPVIDVLIDVGAQVLEATNLELVQQWLRCRTDAKAAVYFDERDEPMVLDHRGVVTSLRISPFSGKLGGCLIYMDEVHTRGIDLAIPIGAHAAVTLGPRLVKDRLTQACMRLRQLGKGHSLCFIAPTEVHRSILDLKGCDDETNLSSYDVLAWSMNQTCQSLEAAKPLRAMQGLEYSRQQKIISEYLPANLSSTSLAADEVRSRQFWNEIQEDESRSLERLYGVQEEHIGALQRLLDRKSSDPMMQHLVGEYDSMNKAAIEDCDVDNEQERELSHEIERQVKVELPPPAPPRQHAISEGVRRYIDTGNFSDLAMCGVKRAFKAMEDTSAAHTLEQQQIDPGVFNVFVSQDFWHTVELPQSSSRDQYMRPVNWILRSTEHTYLLIISPFEANELLPQIKRSMKIRLHTYAPRMVRAMVSFSDLNFYTPNARSSDLSFPIAGVRALNLFAGSLYLDSKAEYEALCSGLGLITQHHYAEGVSVQSDGFVAPQDRKRIGCLGPCYFSKSPLPFLKELFVLRRNGQGFGHTHMGHLLGGRELRADAFDGCTGDGAEEADDTDEETRERTEEPSGETEQTCHVPGAWYTGEDLISSSINQTLVLR